MLTLWPHQQSGADDIRRAFYAGYRRVLYTLPTGGGKTILFSYIATQAAAKGNRVLICVHRRELVRQTVESIRQFGMEPGVIAAGWDGESNARSMVQVASIDTLRTRLQYYPAWRYQILVIDEAHHATAATWEAIISHFDIPTIGVTATPCRLTGKGLGEIWETLIQGPAYSELRCLGCLVDCDLYTIGGDQADGVAISRGDFKRRELESALDRSAVVGDAIDHYREHADGEPAIAFCVSRHHAQKVAEMFSGAGYQSFAVDGATEKAIRDDLIGGLARGDVQVLTSCDLISEGLDVPAARVGIMLRPTLSTALWIQQAGRLLRVAPGKDKAIILDHAGNTYRHGFPDADREWTLERGLEESETRAESITMCKSCFAAFRPGPRVCPSCGAEKVAEPRTPDKVKGRLTKAEREEIERAREEEARRKRREVGRARSYEELLAIEKERGYKPGWACHRWKARERKAG